MSKFTKVPWFAEPYFLYKKAPVSDIALNTSAFCLKIYKIVS